MDSIVNCMDKISICDSENEQEFYLDNSVNSECCYFLAKVQLSFYQLWCMFSELPCVYQSKKSKYEWKFIHKKTGVVFSIYDWKNKQNLLNTKTWYIGASVNNSKITAKFLKVLCDAIECYNKYYKVPVENKTFKSECCEVQKVLDYIKTTIVENKTTLMNL